MPHQLRLSCVNRTALLGVFLLLLLPGSALAATKTSAPPFEISGWIPYWRAATGTADVLPHLQSLSAVMPFGYIVQNDGSLYDAFGFSATSSTSTANLLIAAAKAKRVKVVPTVMWSNGTAIHAILSNKAKRIMLEDRIAALAKNKDFDGINIDFEGKYAKTKPYFSLFLKGLYNRVGNKFVYCAIEARTPVADRYDGTPPPDATEYANDFVALNKYCDRVELMTYDQGTIDLKLSAAASSTPYIPIADPQWVRKVVTLAVKTISKKKIVIGVATYGYEYDLVPLAQGYRYELNWTFNPRYATTLAGELGITPLRNTAGELSFLYAPTTTPATSTSTNPMRRIVWWSDARAIQDKVELAKKLGVRGVALFKLDGGEDPALWNILP